MADARVSVVVLTHDRPVELARTLSQLERLPEQPPLFVVDNASRPGSVEAVVRRHRVDELLRCEQNRGAAGRNAGVARVRTPYVAFCDDDTWWAPGALARAADLLDAHRGVAALSARVLVGDDERLDPACERMARSPLDSTGLPGPALIAFMAGAVVMRCSAYRAVGGYEPRLFLGAEERLMALDFAMRGWRIVYADEVVTHHHPSPSRDPTARRIAQARNLLWIAWMRLPLASAWRESRRILREAAQQGLLAPALREALAGLPWALRHRRVLPPRVQEMVRKVFTEKS
ncbi:MAG TPA: glycosyltransferase [Albitalea sp.]|nr:glycosyltransferase [Albitalea sp.]